MTLRDKIAKALYDNRQAARHPRERRPAWFQVDKIEKDAWRQDADIILKVIKEHRQEIIKKNMQYGLPATLDIYGDQ